MRRSGVPGATSGTRRDVRQVDAACLPVIDRVVRLEQIDAPDHVVEPAYAELRHDAAGLLGHEEEEIDDVLGLALETPAQLRILRRDPDGARVEVAGAHHHAAGGDERSRRESHLVGAEQRRDDDVAPGLELSVGLHPDSGAKIVQHQRLLRLRKADLPRDSREQDR